MKRNEMNESNRELTVKCYNQIVKIRKEEKTQNQETFLWTQKKDTRNKERKTVKCTTNCIRIVTNIHTFIFCDYNATKVEETMKH